MQNLQEILIQAKEGNSEAFTLIYKEFYDPIYRFIYMRVRNADLSLDLTQDVFLKIYKNIESITFSEAAPGAYFYTVARNTLIDHWRKKHIDTVSDEDYMSEIPDDGLNPLDTARLKEDSKLVRECLEELTEDQREVIMLRFIDELSTKEIAEITGKKETAIRQLQVRGLQRLGKIFKQRNG